MQVNKILTNGDIQPFFSIITSTYNAEQFLPTLCQSILNQNFRDFEWLVVDGGSTDSTMNIISSYENIVKYKISESDCGIYDAWNKGLSQSKGLWLIFLGADDFFVNDNSLRDLKLELEKLSECDFILYGQVLQTYKNLRQYQLLGESWDVARKNFFSEMTIPNPGVIYHRSLFEKFGKFKTKFKICGDYEFLMRVIKEGVTPKFFQKEVVVMQYGGVSSSPNSALLSNIEIILAKKDLQIAPLLTRRWLRNFIMAAIKFLIYKLFGKNFLEKIIYFYRFK